MSVLPVNASASCSDHVGQKGALNALGTKLGSSERALNH